MNTKESILKNLYKIESEYTFKDFKSTDSDKKLEDLKGFKYHVKHIPISPSNTRSSDLKLIFIMTIKIKILTKSLANSAQNFSFLITISINILLTILLISTIFKKAR
nr:hypothetical protein [Mycoplasmopsis bovis]